ncbi:MAG: L-threonylcarbamoyladenylate synthase [Bacteroidales bacterium]|jgi:L-threonylcarbamoyladenylate synthase|nr:L-threonylcarbamoyladenylate synthase [Bacteroidales bacterium]HHV40452.1 threonylcarbamoyl-AMP synthase [Bacteroidales bacterium]
MRYSPDIYKHLENATEILRSGGTILYPTDTIWGLGCDACNPKGVEKISALKDRDVHKHYIVLVADLAMLYRYVEYVPDIAENLVQEANKPLTLIYPSGINLAPGVVAEDGSVAIRIPNHDFCQSLIRRLKRPLLSTSANISGTTAPAVFEDIDKALLKKVDWVAPSFLQGGSTGKPSSIIRVGRQNEVEIIRH